jgi:hypothetical protein
MEAGVEEAMPTPRTALNTLKMLQEKVKHLELQLAAATPTEGRSSAPTSPGDATADGDGDGDGGGASAGAGGAGGAGEGSSARRSDFDGEHSEESGEDGAAAVSVEWATSRESPSEVECAESPSSTDAGPTVRFAVPSVEDSPVRRPRTLGSFTAAATSDARRPHTSESKPLTADEKFIAKVTKNLEKLVAGRKPIVLVSTGAYNPIHLQHARMFYLARKV